MPFCVYSWRLYAKVKNVESKKSKAETVWQKRTERGFKEILLRACAKNDHVLIAKLIKHLPANAAGRGVPFRRTCHCDGNEAALPLGNGLCHGASFCANRGRIGRIFNITARVDRAILRKQCRADSKTRKR